MSASRFQIAVPEETLDDLRSRLRRALFTTPSDEQTWRAGTDPDYLRDLVAHWAESFDWRQRERELNALPHYRAELAGRRLHFLHIPGVRPPGRRRCCH